MLKFEFWLLEFRFGSNQLWQFQIDLLNRACLRPWISINRTVRPFQFIKAGNSKISIPEFSGAEISINCCSIYSQEKSIYIYTYVCVRVRTERFSVTARAPPMHDFIRPEMGWAAAFGNEW